MNAIVNDPDVVAEVRQAREDYNAAIARGDTAALNCFFWNSPTTVRFGPAEILAGFEAISTFRSGTWRPGLPRKAELMEVTAIGRDAAATSVVFRGIDGKITRQSQTWARLPEGWRIVAAHVSLMPG